MSLDKKFRVLAQYKAPTTQASNYLGIEVEFISPWMKETLKTALINLGLEKHCNLTTDSSIEVDNDYDEDYYDEDDDDRDYVPNESGHELRILCKETELKVILAKLKIFFTKCGARVNTSCGLHVHLDMRNRDYMAAGKNLLDSLPEIQKLTPEYRFRTSYCELPFNRTMWDERLRRVVLDTRPIDVPRVASLGKYQAINISSYHSKKTIEVRTHEGTVNTKEIFNWCRYLISKVNKRSLPGVKQYVEKRKQQVA